MERAFSTFMARSFGVASSLRSERISDARLATSYSRSATTDRLSGRTRAFLFEEYRSEITIDEAQL